MISWFHAFAFKCKLCRYSKVQQVMASRRAKAPAAALPTSGGAASAAAAAPAPAATTTTSTIEFLCKFEHQSYRQLEWLPLSVMQEAAEGKLRWGAVTR